MLYNQDILWEGASELDDIGLFMVLGWASPIGLGIFIALVSFAVWLNTKRKAPKG